KAQLQEIMIQKQSKNQHRVKVSKTSSTSGDEFNNIEDTRSISNDELNDIESSDTEINILRIEEANNIITRLLQAVSEVTNHRPLVYVRNSVRAKRRQRQLQREAAVRTPKLESFWPSIANACTSMNDSDDTSMNDEPTSSDSDDFEVKIVSDHNLMSPENLNNTIKQLENEFKSNEYSEIEKARLYTMLSYLRLVEHSRKRVEASTIVAKAARKGVYHACCIHAWATNYIQNGAILISKQGKYPKTWSFLWDEDILIQIKSFLRSNKWCVNANELANHVNEKIFPNLCFDLSPMICIRTARNWLEVFGFEYSEVRKGMYIDRHKHTDVVAYCERFLERMAKYETHMIGFSSENIEEETQLAFQDIVILVTHNEYIFSAYDGRRWLWMPKGEQPLRKKGQGQSVHVSEFLTDVGGCLVLREEDKIAFSNLLSEACVITYLAQFPDAKALFAFDNATGHCAYSENALVAKNMNLFPSGK
ncbi:23557_t:CDS:2, partial [Racocetra persica]